MQGAFGCALLLGLVLLGARTYYERRSTLDEARTDAGNLADLLAHLTAQRFASIERALAGVERRIRRGDAPELRAPELRQLLASLKEADADLAALAIVGPEGVVVSAPRTLPPPLSEAAQRTLSGDAGHIGAPVRLADARVIPAVYPLATPDATSRYGLLAALPVASLMEVYRSVALEPAGLLAVYRSDGTVLAGRPEALFAAGGRLEPRPGHADPASGEVSTRRGSFDHAFEVDGIRRVGAYRPVGHLSLHVLTGYSRDMLLARWRQSVSLDAAVGAALLVLFGGLTGVLRSARQRREVERQAQLRALMRLADASAELLTSRDEQQLLERVTELARELVPSRRAGACLLDAYGREVARSDGGGPGAQQQRPPNGVHALERSALQGYVPVRLTGAELAGHPALRLADAPNSSAPRSTEAPFDSWLAIPLVSRDGARLGLIHVADRERRPFSEQDEILLVQLAHIASAVVENVRLIRTSEHSRAEAEAERERLERIRDSISDGFYLLDHQGRFQALNRAAEHQLGVRAEQVLGYTPWELDPDLLDTELPAAFEAAMATGAPRQFVFSWPEHEQLFQVRLYPGEEGLSVFFQDVTEQRKTEEQLRQAQKMEVVGQLTGGVAHDFNNLLTVILGQTRLVQQQLSESVEREALEAVVDASQRAAELTRRLLAFSRRQPLAPSVVDLGKLLQDLEKMLDRMLGEQIEIEMVRGAGLWPVEVDAGQFEAAVMNLAINARDAMPEGGQLSIEATNARVDDHYATQHAVAPGQYVMTAVTDNGVGMDAETAARAFEPFFTTKEPGEGTGLGLSMVYGFIRQSGGHVKIYSERDEGTTVRIYLPRAQPHGGAAPDATAAPEVSGGEETVLLVEDDDLVREFTRGVLTDLGYRTVAVPDGPTALRALETIGRLDGCRPAARHERPRGRGRDSRPSARSQGALHLRLQRQRDHAPGPPGPRRRAAQQAIHARADRAAPANPARRGVDPSPRAPKWVGSKALLR